MAAIASGIPLTIVAGIPDNLRVTVLENLNKSFRSTSGYALRSFAFLSGQKAGAQYKSHTIMKCLEGLATRIHKKRENRESLDNPNHISIVYLEAAQDSDNDLLLSNFFTFAQCIKIQIKAKAWWLYSSSELSELFKEEIIRIPSWRNSQGYNYVFLPLNHFTVNNNQSLFDVCLERAKKFPTIPPIIKKIIPLSKCKRSKCGNCPQKDGVLRPKDSRGLCFVSSARDGSPYGADEIWKNFEDAKSMKDKINYSKVYIDSYYRFGIPILTGTHFDVQYPGQKKIREKTFQCPQRGGMPKEECNYVNIYPNGTVNMP